MSQKKKLLLILALAVIVIVAGAVILTNRKDSTNTTQENKQNTDLSEADVALLGETFTDSQTGVSMRIPKGWQLAPKNDENPSSLTKFVQTTTSGGPGANGELLARETSASLDDIVRGYMEAAMDIYATPKLENKDVLIGNRVVRLLSQEMPGPNGVTGRITQYIIHKKGTYYIVNYAMLASDFEAQRPGIEASVKSLKLPQ